MAAAVFPLVPNELPVGIRTEHMLDGVLARNTFPTSSNDPERLGENRVLHIGSTAHQRALKEALMDAILTFFSSPSMRRRFRGPSFQGPNACPGMTSKMSTFTDWLLSTAQSTDSALKPLADFAGAKKPEWKRAEDDKDALAKLIDDSLPDDAAKAASLKSELETAWEAWDRARGSARGGDETKASLLHRLGEFFTRNAAAISSLILAGIFLVILTRYFGDPNLLAQLRDVATARGTITFLFSLGTIVLALLLLFSALYSNDDREDRKERFTQGKEVLTILIGILGTIVGFYFGSEKAETSQQKQFSVAQVELTESTPKPGGTTDIVTYVEGGEPPYRFTVDFPDDTNITDITGQKDKDGLIFQNVAIPDGIGNGKEVSFDMIIRDATGKEEKAAGKFVTSN